MMTVRYMNLLGIGIEQISLAHTWLGAQCSGLSVSKDTSCALCLVDWFAASGKSPGVPSYASTVGCAYDSPDTPDVAAQQAGDGYHRTAISDRAHRAGASKPCLSLRYSAIEPRHSTGARPTADTGGSSKVVVWPQPSLCAQSSTGFEGLS